MSAVLIIWKIWPKIVSQENKSQLNLFLQNYIEPYLIYTYLFYSTRKISFEECIHKYIFWR